MTGASLARRERDTLRQARRFGTAAQEAFDTGHDLGLDGVAVLEGARHGAFTRARAPSRPTARPPRAP